MSRIKRLLFLAIITVVIAACSKHDKNTITVTKKHVDVLTLKLQNVPYGFDYPASVSGVVDFPVIPRVSGVIMQQLYKEGTYVKKHQKLYQIDPRPYEMQLKVDQGQLIKDLSSAREYKKILNRYLKLYKVGGVSKQDIETATINYKTSYGQAQADIANIKNDKLNILYCSVDSPADGLISERQVTVGQMVSAYQTTLNNINSQNNLFINFSVPENDRLELKRNIATKKVIVPNDFKFAIDLELADGSMLYNAGKVNFFDTRISLQNGTWNMRADVDNTKIKQQLLSGQFVHVYLRGAYFNQVIALPQSAVFRDDKNAFVYIVDKNNKVKRQDVLTGLMSNTLWVIESGLTPTDTIITNGGMKVLPGDEVIIDTSANQN